MLIYNPLEQFEIINLFSFFNFQVTNSGCFLFFSFFSILFFSQVLFFETRGFLIPNRFQVLFEFFYCFVLNIVTENIRGKFGQSFFPIIFFLFFCLLLCNAFGLIPHSFTVTSHFIVTFTLSSFIWFGKLFIGFQLHGFRFFSLLLPSGVPVVLIPFFIFVEFLSFLIPLVALGVRLFANIIAGHILLKVIVGFCWSIITAGNFLFFFHFMPLIILFLLLFLETAVACIQAYIFTILSCLIIGDAVRGGH